MSRLSVNIAKHTVDDKLFVVASVEGAGFRTNDAEIAMQIFAKRIKQTIDEMNEVFNQAGGNPPA